MNIHISVGWLVNYIKTFNNPQWAQYSGLSDYPFLCPFVCGMKQIQEKSAFEWEIIIFIRTVAAAIAAADEDEYEDED